MTMAGDEGEKTTETGKSRVFAGFPQKANSSSIPMLILSLLLDFIGMTTYFIPGITEIFDVIWAPVQAVLFYIMYRWKIGALFAFAEEILPGTDFIPSFTTAWVINYIYNKKRTSKKGNNPTS